MEINKKIKENETILALCGRLDTTTAPELNKELTDLFEDGVKDLVLDFEQLEYISSAGLRALLFAKKSVGEEGDVVIRNVNDMIMEILEITGFKDILTIE